MGQPRPLSSFIFGLFKQTSLQILQQITVKKCPSRLQCQDLNPRPLVYESPSITTRPGLPPITKMISGENKTGCWKLLSVNSETIYFS